VRAIGLEWRGAPPGLIDGAVLRADMLCALPDEELFPIRVNCGKDTFEIGELFHVRPLGGASPETLRIEGSERFVRLASGMRSGRLEIEGHGGTLLGAGLLGGEIIVSGDVSHGACAGMIGGIVRIEGDAGDEVGGPLPGARLGMQGGEVLVHGSAGACAAHRLRRGLIAIAGTAGPRPALAMAAGTLIIGDGDLDEPGIGMSRGTVVGLSARVDPPLGFALDGTVRPVFWRVLARRLVSLAFPGAERSIEASFRSFSGDLTALGRGEILYRLPGK